MKKAIRLFIILLLTGSMILLINAQPAGLSERTASSGDYLVARPIPDRIVSFSISDSGFSRPLLWGLDTAWPSEENIRRGVAFMGADHVDIVRASFQPTLPLIDGDLQAEQVEWINYRLDLVDLTGPDTKVALNCDHPSVDPWYAGNAPRWAQLMDVTARRVQERGRTIASIAPFNEPDYGWGQGSIGDFYNIAGELRQNPRFDSIRISGGNTLNTDEALYWYNYLRERLDEGNTHQLAGSFDNYASFYEAVRANGDHATNDEMHNVMEAMVGVEYGLQTGIWWGTAERARGEFVKASGGKRLGYAEHRPNWTAASVYRHPEGRVQAFGGSSERQAATTTYLFVSKEHDVYYDGYGPQRDYIMLIPGGTGYQQGQTNAERVVSISWGDDIQPVIDGRYVLVNRNSGKVMEVTDGALSAGANVRQATPTGATYQQWNVIPVDPRVVGDFSYFTITAAHSAKAADVYNWSLIDGGNIIVWDDVKGANQQWFLEYAEDGWFYIRSRWSAKCLDVYNAGTAHGVNIIQKEKNGGASQQWRFLPVGAPVEFDPPGAPEDLSAKANAESIRLEWSAGPETDVAGYAIFRSESAGGPCQTIARNVGSTSFVDNTIPAGVPFFYRIRAMDHSLNRSAYSGEVSATATGSDDLVAHFPFEGSTRDSSINMNHSAPYGTISYVEGPDGSGAIALNGTDAFLQLPATLANRQEMTIAAWVYWNGGASWQRIFEFCNDQDETMYLQPRLRFAIRNGGTEQRLEASALPVGEWAHVAVTLGATGACLYVNGDTVDESGAVTIRPSDFKPVLNYIGRSLFAVPLFNGCIDDFRVYNYALPAGEVAQISEVLSDEGPERESAQGLSLWPVPAKDVLYVNYDGENNHGLLTLEVLDINSRVFMHKEIKPAHDTELDVSGLPSGIYLLKLTGREGSLIRKFIIRR